MITLETSLYSKEQYLAWMPSINKNAIEPWAADYYHTINCYSFTNNLLNAIDFYVANATCTSIEKYDHYVYNFSVKFYIKYRFIMSEKEVIFV